LFTIRHAKVGAIEWLVELDEPGIARLVAALRPFHTIEMLLE
jgi:hypothetical protein